MSVDPTAIRLADLDPEEWAVALELAAAEGAVVQLDSIVLDEVLVARLSTPAILALVDLRNATFENDVDLVAAGLLDHSFDDVTFSGAASFAEGILPNQVAFARTRFAGPATFADAKLGEDHTSFRSVVFDDSCSFAGARLAETTTFSGVSFRGPVTFEDAIAPSRFLMFERCVFGATLTIEGLVTGYDTQITFKECELVDGGAIEGTIVGPGAIVTRDCEPKDTFTIVSSKERGRNNPVDGPVHVQLEHRQLDSYVYVAPSVTAAVSLIKRLELTTTLRRHDDGSFALVVASVSTGHWRLSSSERPDETVVVDAADLETHVNRALSHLEVRHES